MLRVYVEQCQRAKQDGVMIDDKGNTKYVILSADEFKQYREYQLDVAIAAACLANGNYRTIDNYAKTLEKEM